MKNISNSYIKTLCTIGAKKINKTWYLIKTRDPVPWMRMDDEIKLYNNKVDKFKKLIIQNPDPKEDGYYAGINEKGVAFVATFLLAGENLISFIRRPYIRLILDAENVQEGLKIIKAFNPKISGNMFIADKNQCFLVEGVTKKYHIEEVKEYAVRTNHFLKLPYKNKRFDMDPEYESWSKTRYERALEIIEKAKTIKDLQNILKDRKHYKDHNSICAIKKDRINFTHSAIIFNTKNPCVHYAQGNPLYSPFKKYVFYK